MNVIIGNILMVLGIWAAAGLILLFMVLLIFGDGWLTTVGKHAWLDWFVVFLIGPIAWFPILSGATWEARERWRTRRRKP